MRIGVRATVEAPADFDVELTAEEAAKWPRLSSGDKRRMLMDKAPHRRRFMDLDPYDVTVVDVDSWDEPDPPPESPAWRIDPWLPIPVIEEEPHPDCVCHDLISFCGVHGLCECCVTGHGAFTVTPTCPVHATRRWEGEPPASVVMDIRAARAPKKVRA